ncbi:MAG: hypothetical protein AAF632_13520 [Bacteroidota bacterium]
MTKAERIQLIKVYFDEVARIDGAVPCIQWKHRNDSDIFLYSRESESADAHEIVLVKSATAQIDKALSHSVKHYFRDAEDLEVLLRSLSIKTVASKPVVSPQPKQSFQPKPKPKPAFAGTRPAVKKPPIVESKFRPPAAPRPTVNPSSYAPQRPNIPHTPSPASYAPSSPSAVKIKISRPKGIWVGLLAALGILGMAILTNPSEEKHRRAVSQSGHQELLQSSLLTYSESTAPDEVNSTLVSTNGSSFTSPVHRKNFYIFSLTELQFPDYSKIVGLGIFGKVFLDEPEESTTSEVHFTNDIASASVDPAKLTEMRRAVIVAVMDKFYADANNQQDYTYKFVFHNRSNRSISSFAGQVVFNDAQGNLVKSLSLIYDRPLGIGERAVFHIVDEASASLSGDDAIVLTDLSDLSVEWQPTELLFKDGTTMSL